MKVKIGKDSNNEEDDFALFNGMQGKVVGVEAWSASPVSFSCAQRRLRY